MPQFPIQMQPGQQQQQQQPQQMNMQQPIHQQLPINQQQVMRVSQQGKDMLKCERIQIFSCGSTLS